MHPLIETLLESGVVVTDGSWGTQLQKRGIKRGECPDSWNLVHPDWVEEVARGYVEAGSQVILTNTFQSNRLSLGRFDLADKAVEINARGVSWLTTQDPFTRRPSCHSAEESQDSDNQSSYR